MKNVINQFATKHNKKLRYSVLAVSFVVMVTVGKIPVISNTPFFSIIAGIVIAAGMMTLLFALDRIKNVAASQK